VDVDGAVTSNQTLRQWLPGKTTIAELIAVTIDQRTQLPDENSQASVHVVYQTPTLTRWKQNGQEDAEELQVTGRTLEESFAMQNLDWCQDKQHKDLGLRIPRAQEKGLIVVTEAIGKRVRGKKFRKTDFALALMHKEEVWEVPAYIHDGLRWLESKIMPPVEADNSGGAEDDAAVTTEEEA
jgi:hypothetical protein